MFWAKRLRFSAAVYVLPGFAPSGANVLDANVAVSDRLVDDSEIGADMARARGEVASHELCDLRLVVAEDL